MATLPQPRPKKFIVKKRLVDIRKRSPQFSKHIHAVYTKARPPSAALQPPRTPDMQYLPPSCCTTHPFRPPMFQRANPPHYFHPHKAYENKTQEPPPPAKPASRQKDYDDNEKRKLKKPIPRLCEQTQRTPLPPATGLRHLLHSQPAGRTTAEDPRNPRDS